MKKNVQIWLDKAIRTAGNYLLSLKFDVVTATLYAAARHYQPDVVHCHDLKTLPCGVKLKKNLRCKLIYDAHEYERDVLPVDRFTNYTAKITKQVIAIEANAKQADGVITVSASIAAALHQLIPLPTMPSVIYNVPRTIVPTNRNLRKDANLSDDTPILIYVGGIMHARGVDFLISALQFLPEFHLVAVGNSRPIYMNKIKAQAQAAGVADRFILLPSVPPAEVVSYIGTTHAIGVHALESSCLSHIYSMSNKIFEMSFARLPILITPLLDQRQFIKEFANGLTFDEGNIQSFVEKVRTMLTHLEHYQITDENYAKLVQRYGWPAQEKTLRDLYTRVLQG